ncbi:NEAT domain-containing protein [Viridibacillus sp. YIM B01967]|uniref:NEAT domain-containing protein n=1 Tax=Viridibacillus soli TaxID=2798301 RepID=A0ABS1HD95_9BACL|nr:NEAT domain-containing protein [Viridibacillus soli]MBK3497355.1 NEAT domain-containing protein [Viridibacillus soli]
MNKVWKIIISALLIVFTLLPNFAVGAASAADALKDGKYEVGIKFLADSTETISKMTHYINTTAQLELVDGQMSAVVDITDSSSFTGFKVDQKGVLTNVKTVSEDTANKVRTVQFQVPTLDQKLNAEVTVEVKAMNYKKEYKVQIQFDPESLKLIELNQPEIVGKAVSFKTIRPDSAELIDFSRYLGTPATVTKIAGKQYVYINIVSSSSMIPYLQAEQNGVLVNMEEVSRDDTANTRVVRFPATDLSKPIAGTVKVTAGTHEMEYKFRFLFDGATVETVDPEKTISADLKGKDYSATVKVTGKESFLVSQSPAVSALSEEVGKKYVSVTLAESSKIKALKVKKNGQYIEVSKAKVNSTQRAATVTTYKVEVADWNSKLEAVADMQDSTTEEFTVQLSNVKMTPVVGEDTVVSKNNLKDGQYTIPFKLLTDGTNDPSVMNSYVKPTASLKVENGKQYVAMTLKNAEWIKGFKVEQGGKLVEPTVIRDNLKANERVVQFEVKDLTKNMDAWVKVNVPEINYAHDYTVQMQFDLNGIKLIKSNTDSSTITKPKSDNNETTEKPVTNNEETADEEKKKPNTAITTSNDVDVEFDRNGDVTNMQDPSTETAKASKVVNPKTMDTAKLALLLSMIAISGYLLVRKYKAREASE